MKIARKFRAPFWVVIIALALCVPAAMAQQKDPRVSPAGPVPPIAPGESSSVDPAAVTPSGPGAVPQQERTPLTSAENWSPGGVGAGRNFLLPSLSITISGDTRQRQSGSGLNLRGGISGQFVFQHVLPRGQFQADYRGGETFYSASSNRSRYYQDFLVSYRRLGQTWAFLLTDAVDYSPEGGGSNGLGFSQLGANSTSASGNSLIGLNSQFLPNQSITSTNSPRISNTILGEFRRTLGPRSVVTVSGSYGILRFMQDGPIDGNTISFRGGYNYTLTARDTLGLAYSGSLFQYQGTSRENLSHTFQLSYGRQLTGRLMMRVGGGPQVTRVDTLQGSQLSYVSWSLDNSLRYRLERMDLGLTYIHGVTGGSGVFLGSRTDQVDAFISRQLSRVWRGRTSIGYAHNDSLRELAEGTSSRRYNTWRGNLELSRPIGRSTRMYFRYGVERQTSTVACTTSNCPLSGVRQIFGVGFDFRFREIELE